ADGKGNVSDLKEMQSIVKQVSVNSKCGFGQSALFPVLDAVKYYKADFLALIKGEKNIAEKHYSSAVTAPCIDACPAGLDVPGYIELIKNNKPVESLNLIREKCILPGVVGRVCTHPCEDACVRKDIDEPLAIRLLKRAASDADLAEGGSALKTSASKKDEKVAIIGAGPAGLAAAYNLRMMGYGVTIFESLPHAGGMASVGIPDYRLPTDILDHEINLIRRTGVEIKLNAKVDSLSFKELKKEGYAAVFAAVGAHEGNKMGIEGEDEGYDGYVDGVDLLRDLNLGKKIEPRKKVVIVGGGNVALDCARSCARLGFKEVNIVYRRSRVEMPASDEEIEGALEEGIKITYLAVPVKILEKDGKITGVECIKIKLGRPDESGRRRPIPVKGSEYTLKTDVVVAAIGQRPVLPLSKGKEKVDETKWGTIKTNPVTCMTNVAGVFAGGDCVTGPATLIEALDMGNRVARNIDAFITGRNIRDEMSFAGVDLKKQRGRGFVVGEKAREVEFMAVEKRLGGFDEVEGGFGPARAMEEAGRCLRCYRVVVWE
ncbi:MAG: FAD-dependent oxidoreductase, partial [Thermodesulfobacteriota bacterium]|nr:FAD-dependent oxidoreductase [Thermodesulfobacteriota bacterium]